MLIGGIGMLCGGRVGYQGDARVIGAMQRQRVGQ